MLCKYSYLLKEKLYICGGTRYYTFKTREVGEYECDMDDFKKLFDKHLQKMDCAIILRKQNGEIWIWQPKCTSWDGRRQAGGWSLVDTNRKYTDTYERSIRLQKLEAEAKAFRRLWDC